MTTKGLIITITRTSSGHRIEFPYNAKIVEAIKATIPARHRSWDKQTKTWTVVSTTHTDLFAARAESLGCKVIRGITKPRSHPVGTWARDLLDRVQDNPELHKKLVRALSKALHPDMGGDQCLMQELNDADADVRKSA